jgi:transcriptional regulator with XRE-family HTH domain
VKSLRLQATLSQEAFTHKCGLDRNYITGIERGVKIPTLEVIALIAQGLSVEIATLLFNI